MFFVGAVLNRTTLADFDAIPTDAAHAFGTFTPDFVLESTFGTQSGTGTNDYSLRIWRMDDGRVYDKYMVDCVTAVPGTPARATLLQLVDQAANPSKGA